MTLAAYQDAFARMTLSPALCRRVREHGEAALADPALSAVERTRLVALARQRGMRITCILARANRLSSLVGALPLTCELLKPQLGALLDRYWDAQPMATLQALPEGLAFARHLQREIASSRLAVPHAGDVLRLERARLELQLAAHVATDGSGSAPARRRSLRFEHDLAPLLEALAAGRTPPGTLVRAATRIVLDFGVDPPHLRIERLGAAAPVGSPRAPRC